MLHVDDRGRVRVLQLDRPDRLNAFDHEQYALVADALTVADDDEDVGVVVLTGAGRAFSAGADLTAIRDPEQAGLFAPQFERMLDALGTFTKPLIGAVNGLAVGIGTTILLHCDIVLADEEARFRTPFPQLGTTPEAGSSLLLTRAVGPQVANWMLLTGEWVDASTASRAGLVAGLCPPGTVLDAAVELATSMADLHPGALAAGKRLVRHGLDDLVRAARARETAAGQELAALGGGLRQATSPR